MSVGHWEEILDHNSEVVRVWCEAGKFVFRVCPHKDRTWRAEHRAAGHWRPLRQAPRGPYKAMPIRQWRSPKAAMRAVEKDYQLDRWEWSAEGVK